MHIMNDLNKVWVVDSVQNFSLYFTWTKLNRVRCSPYNNAGGTENAWNNNVNGDTVRYGNDLQRCHGRHLRDPAMSVARHITPRHVHVINCSNLLYFSYEFHIAPSTSVFTWDTNMKTKWELSDGVNHLFLLLWKNTVYLVKPINNKFALLSIGPIQ